MATSSPVCLVCLRPIPFLYATLPSGRMTHVSCVASPPARRRTGRRRRWAARAWRRFAGSAPVWRSERA